MDKAKIASAKNVPLEVLLNNCFGTSHGFPRTAAWGYPEPYTRDLMMIIYLPSLACGSFFWGVIIGASTLEDIAEIG